MKIAIIGGGLAGTACAYMLSKAGAEPVIYEAGPDLASGASGNEIGLYNPRFTAEMTPEAEFHISGFKLARQIFQELQDVDWDPCGALHLMNTEQKIRRYPKTLKSWGHEVEMRLVSTDEASEIAGVELRHEALYLPGSGSVNPRKLCEKLAEGVDVHRNARIESLGALEADAVILACGMGVLGFPEAAHLRLKPVRGQITLVSENDSSPNLKCNLCYGGYISRAQRGVHALGATFQRWVDDTDILPEDDTDNLKKLTRVAPDLAAGLEIAGHRAGLRAATPHHLPYVGMLSPKVYVSAGHGSHGILTALAGAEILTDMILQRALPKRRGVIAALAPGQPLT